MVSEGEARRTMDDIILFRIAERLTLTLVVLLVALVVMIGFWRTVQKIDLAEGARLGLGGSFVFSTPVFVLLAIIGYAWVSLEHPITVAPRAGSGGTEVAQVEGGSFIGAAPVAGAPESDGYDLATVQRRLRSLNCLAETQALSARTEDDLAQVKLGLMAAVWQPDWGSQEAFADWALGIGSAPPEGAAQAVYDGLHVAC
jgi:hypothetical protein